MKKRREYTVKWHGAELTRDGGAFGPFRELIEAERCMTALAHRLECHGAEIMVREVDDTDEEE